MKKKIHKVLTYLIIKVITPKNFVFASLIHRDANWLQNSKLLYAFNFSLALVSELNENEKVIIVIIISIF